MGNLFLGLDLGGTNVKAGIVNAEGKLIAKVSTPTGGNSSDLAALKVVETMIKAGHEAIAAAGVKKDDIAAVGVLSPGQASLKEGIVYRSANFPKWRNVKLRSLVSAGLNLPAILENDANAAAYGEFWAGAGKDKPIDNMIMFTLGTGVGGGVVYKGEVIRGSFDFAAEVGHMIMIPGGELCGCGQRGCLEAYCSAGYTGKRATRLLKTTKTPSTMRKTLKEKGAITALDVELHARKKDKLACQVWEETCHFIALASINACHWLDPQMIVLAGGMSGAGSFLTKTVNKHFRAEWWKMTKPMIKIEIAKLGNDAGVIGAAGVAKVAYDKKELPGVGE